MIDTGDLTMYCHWDKGLVCKKEFYCDTCEHQPAADDKENGKAEPVHIRWAEDYWSGRYPECPSCGNMPYSLERCVFCGQRFLPEPEIHKAEPTLLRAKPSRAETMFGPKEAWAIPDRAEAEETTPKTYKGFLLIRCAQCGELRGFCAKQPISSYRCATCNGETPLHDLTSAHIRCKCGKHFKYRTNFEEDVFTYSCLSCGAPVDLAYNKKARAYQTVR